MLKWPRHAEGDLVVTHHPDVRPHRLLALLRRTDFREVGSTKVVRVFRDGPNWYCARDYSNPDMGGTEFYAPGLILGSLKRLRKTRSLEEPVAYIAKASLGRFNSGFGGVLITRWHPDATAFAQFIQDPEVRTSLKIRAVQGLTVPVSRLHAEGYQHGHLADRNVVVFPSGRTLLVDPSLLSNPERPEDLEKEAFGLFRDSANDLMDFGLLDSAGARSLAQDLLGRYRSDVLRIRARKTGGNVC